MNVRLEDFGASRHNFVLDHLPADTLIDEELIERVLKCLGLALIVVLSTPLNAERTVNRFEKVIHLEPFAVIDQGLSLSPNVVRPARTRADMEFRTNQVSDVFWSIACPLQLVKRKMAQRREANFTKRSLTYRDGPEADLTGAIQHAMGALECVAREVCGDPKATLGEVIKQYPGTIPRPLDESIAKAWGFASEKARHIREGGTPDRKEVELVVGLAATVATYLSR